jgi:hypothetical protein
MSRARLLSGLLALLCLWPVLADPEGRDRYGDPLPPGALARMGTMRLRHV